MGKIDYDNNLVESNDNNNVGSISVSTYSSGTANSTNSTG